MLFCSNEDYTYKHPIILLDEKKGIRLGRIMSYTIDDSCELLLNVSSMIDHIYLSVSFDTEIPPKSERKSLRKSERKHLHRKLSFIIFRTGWYAFKVQGKRHMTISSPHQRLPIRITLKQYKYCIE